MRKPVVEAVVGHLLLARAVRVEAPDLYRARPERMKVNPPAVGRVVGAVVVARVGGEARLGPAGDRDRVDVVVAFALGAVGERLAVRRPAVPERGGRRVHAPWQAASGRKQIHLRLARLGEIADHELCAVGREAVVVDAVYGESRVHWRGLRPRGQGQTLEPAAAIEPDRRAIGGKMRRIQTALATVDHRTLPGGDRDNLQRRGEPRRLSRRERRQEQSGDGQQASGVIHV